MRREMYFLLCGLYVVSILNIFANSDVDNRLLSSKLAPQQERLDPEYFKVEMWNGQRVIAALPGAEINNQNILLLRNAIVCLYPNVVLNNSLQGVERVHFREGFEINNKNYMYFNGTKVFLHKGCIINAPVCGISFLQIVHGFEINRTNIQYFANSICCLCLGAVIKANLRSLRQIYLAEDFKIDDQNKAYLYNIGCILLNQQNPEQRNAFLRTAIHPLIGVVFVMDYSEDEDTSSEEYEEEEENENENESSPSSEEV